MKNNIKKQPTKEWRKIKSYEDACERFRINPKAVEDNNSPDVIAYKKLKIIICAINQGWIPNWNDEYQKKWWPYFKMSPMFEFSDSYFAYSFSCADVCSSLCIESDEKTTYVGKQFIDLYKIFFT
jgi:hypothetical protein